MVNNKNWHFLQYKNYLLPNPSLPNISIYGYIPTLSTDAKLKTLFKQNSYWTNTGLKN